MAILVCGGAGYIGSHVNKQLHQAGYQTVVFDNLEHGHREAVQWGELVVGDLKNRVELQAVFEHYPIEAVMHFAAYIAVGESVENPEKYYYNNVVNTLNLLQCMRQAGCQQLIFSSTCAVCGQPEQIPLTEDAPQHPTSPYGRSKLMVEKILLDYAQAYGLDFVGLRYFNASGDDRDGEIGESCDKETHLIPIVLDAASGKRESIKVFGTDYNTPDGSCIRDYIHVQDLASAHLLALQYLERNSANQVKTSEFFNLGSGKGVSVLEVIDTVKRITQRDFKVVVAPRRAGDPAQLVGSYQKAQQLLGWTPQYSDIDTIVQDAWRWHQHRRF